MKYKKYRAYIEIEKTNWKAVFVSLFSFIMMANNLYCFNIVDSSAGLYLSFSFLLMFFVTVILNLFAWSYVFVFEGLLKLRYIEKIPVKVMKK